VGVPVWCRGSAARRSKFPGFPIRGRAGGPATGRMPVFLAETYAPRGRRGTAAPRLRYRAGRRAGQRPGGPVRFMGAILVPGEETRFRLYEASSVGVVARSGDGFGFGEASGVGVWFPGAGHAGAGGNGRD
jgi:hypothetical protein